MKNFEFSLRATILIVTLLAFWGPERVIIFTLLVYFLTCFLFICRNLTKMIPLVLQPQRSVLHQSVMTAVRSIG
jgi:hypothetical protein